MDICDPSQLTESRSCVPDTNIKGKAACSDLGLREARFLGSSPSNGPKIRNCHCKKELNIKQAENE